MGKIYTFINKNCVNTKVKTSELQQYLDDGWQIGNWNQEELNKNSGAGVIRHYQKLRAEGSYENFSEQKSARVSEGLRKFWQSQGQEYRDQREVKKRDTVAKQTDEYKEFIHNKMSESAKRDRANTSAEEFHRRSILATKTKKKNSTFGKSKFEDAAYTALCESYGIDDVIQHYNTDSRYNWECDFYIKSLDKFIELNIHPSHYEHPFDETNEDDINIKQQLENDDSQWSKMILDVWCRRDVIKLNEAKNNNLNYLTVYPKQFDDFLIRVQEKLL